MDFLIGLLGLIAGAAIALAGLRYFFILLPIGGFIVGFFAGAAGISAIFDDGFLATSLGLLVGVLVGLLFALISYFYWYFSVVLLAAMAGSVLGTSLFAWIGIDADWLLFLVGLAFAVVFAIGSLLLNLPVYLVIVSSALAGSAIAIGGALMVFNQFDREEIGTGALWERIDEHWYLWLIWIVVAGIGIAIQMLTVAMSQIPEEKWAAINSPTVPAETATA